MKCVVVHSGGMDSSICLALAVNKYGSDEVLSMSFKYGQRHSIELDKADKISKHFQVKHVVIPISSLERLTKNALLDKSMKITHKPGEEPNTLVVGRNGLMARLAAIHADDLGAAQIVMGVIEVEAANSGYRDCTRAYMDLLQNILQIDLGNKQFNIWTPLVAMTKAQTMELADSLGVLSYLLEETVTCYEGVEKQGCLRCPACKLRNAGIVDFQKSHPEFSCSYLNKLL